MSSNFFDITITPEIEEKLQSHYEGRPGDAGPIWLIYRTTDMSDSNMTELCDCASHAYSNLIPNVPDGPEGRFMAPVPSSLLDEDFAGQTPADILPKHLTTIDANDRCEAFRSGVYPYGFVVACYRDWREHGVLVVNCDKDSEEDEEVEQADPSIGWHASMIRMPVKELGLNLTSVAFEDDNFDNIKEQYTGYDLLV
jgi:hypothetical protein